jgi:hypothetical protein
MTAKLALPRSATFADAPGHLGGQFRVRQEQLDKRGNHFLSGHSGVSEPVGSVSLPNVEGAMGGGGQVDGATGALAPRWRLRLFAVWVAPDALETFGLR